MKIGEILYFGDAETKPENENTLPLKVFLEL
jgi:hypothetical protein